MSGVGGRIAQSDDSILSDGNRDFFIGQTLEAGTYFVAIAAYGSRRWPLPPTREHARGHHSQVPHPGPTTGKATAVSILGSEGDGDKFTFTPSGTKDVFVYTLGSTDTKGKIGSGENDDGGMSPRH